MMFFFLSFLVAPFHLVVIKAIPSWPSVASGTTAGFASLLATFDPSWDWRLIVELATLVLMLVLAFKPTPPLHEQFAGKEEVEKHKREIWEVINGLRGAVAAIKTSVEGIKTLREANGSRLDELSKEQMELIKEVSRLGERTETLIESIKHGRGR